MADDEPPRQSMWAAADQAAKLDALRQQIIAEWLEMYGYPASERQIQQQLELRREK